MLLSKMFNRVIKSNKNVSVEVFGATDTGRRRPRNEDTFLFANLNKKGENELFENKFAVEENGALMLVADGMGGAAAGDVASKMASETIYIAFKELPQEMDIPLRLKTAVDLANQRIFEHAQANPELRGMGTTLTAVYIQDSIAYIAQVGDSRAYLLRGNKIKQITKDQTLAQYLFDIGQITRDKMRIVPQNVILQALGTEKNIDPTISAIRLCKDDYLLLCSDGLSNKLFSLDIHKTVSSSSGLRDAVNQLVALANERGGEDNITVVLVRFSGSGLAESCTMNTTMDLEKNYKAA